MCIRGQVRCCMCIVSHRLWFFVTWIDVYICLGMLAIEGVFVWVRDIRGQCFRASRVALWAAYVWCLCVVDVDARWFLIVLHGGVSVMVQM